MSRAKKAPKDWNEAIRAGFSPLHAADDAWAKERANPTQPPPGMNGTAHGKANGTAGPHTTKSSNPQAAPLRAINVWEMLKTPAPPRSWHIPKWQPGDDVTGLFGDGGEGKTQLGLQLCYCTATNMPWMGMNVRPGPAIYVSAEEPEKELHFRLEAISNGIIAPDEAVRHPLEVVSRAESDAFLCTMTKSGLLAPTPLFKELSERIGDIKPALVALDAAADVFGGNEIDRTQVRNFISMLRQIAVRHDTSILLMGHPSRDGIRSGLGYSGSTAWHNSVRARWYLQRQVSTDEDGIHVADDPDLRELSLQKTNRGQPGEKLTLRWQNGWFGLDGGSSTDKPITEGKVKDRFLTLLARFTAEGRQVSHNLGPTYAPKQFADHPQGKPFSSKQYAKAMNALFSDGQLRVVTEGPPSRPRTHLERQ